MTSENVKNIIVKQLTNRASHEELKELDLWLSKNGNEEEYKKYVETNYIINYNLKEFNSAPTKEKIHQIIKNEKKVLRLKRNQKILKYAAIFVGLLASTYFLYINAFDSNKFENEEPKIVEIKNVLPGKDKAILTLEDNSQIALEKGAIYKNANAKSNGKQIVYKNKTNREVNTRYNYLTIPRGGQFQITLSDGTKVWLNSESKLKYPVNFAEGKERKVELVYGEAYFDVSPSTKHNGSRFSVFNKSQKIKVLGTEFNIKAYKDESIISTTLVEGKITVNTSNKEQIMIPNQQLVYNKTTQASMIHFVDVNVETSWRRGIFSFQKRPLKEVMRVISRWYDIDVVFKNKNLETITCKGVLGRDQSIKEILDAIKLLSDVKEYKINRNTLILE